MCSFICIEMGMMHSLSHVMETSEITDDLMGVWGTHPDVGWINLEVCSTRGDTGRGSRPIFLRNYAGTGE